MIKAPLLGRSRDGGSFEAKMIYIRCFTPSVTAFGGDSSLKEGALAKTGSFLTN